LETLIPLWKSHGRSFEKNRYVYPVLSRRAEGISVGINLNPDKGCNFDCVYCQVDRTPAGMEDVGPVHQTVETMRLLEELGNLLKRIHDGDFFRNPPYETLPPLLQRIADIAFSGDGEPTMVPEFPDILKAVADFRNSTTGLLSVPIRIITNGTGLFKTRIRTSVRESLLLEQPLPRPGSAVTQEIFDEVWFKIDAADPGSFARIDRSAQTFDRYQESVSETLQDLPVTLQTMVLDIRDTRSPFRPEGLWAEAMRDWVTTLQKKGARIRQWHLYTVARKPPSPEILAVSSERLGHLADFFRQSVSCPIAIFP
jgi:wyosine [tRNA(Phe)-imidazoG37] synthetase (radical SAM superfamily)